MENKQAQRVVFRNVGKVYFPQSRVECHYSLTSEHQWSSSDWIGLFKVGWTSLKDYHTYMWATAPEGPMIDYTEGNQVNSCALFAAFYLPQPSETLYQFVYVSQTGEVCGQSASFTFSAPKTLEEVETMKEGEEMLLVVSRAQLLQSQLEECQQQVQEVRRALELEQKEVELQKESSRKARGAWEQERAAMKDVIAELRGNLRLSLEKLRKMEGRHQDVQYTRENMSSELSLLWTEKAAKQQRIKELEDEVKVLTERVGETDTQLERMREREKKLSAQLKREEEKGKSLQVEKEASVEEVRVLRDRLAGSEHVCEALRRELSEAGLQRDHTHAELHRTRLHKAQLAREMSDENLAFYEGRTAWAQEREALCKAAEIEQKKLQQLRAELQQKEEWLQEERAEREKLEKELSGDYMHVRLNYARKEVQEMKDKIEKEQKEKQELSDYILELEQKVKSEETKSDGTSSFDSVEEEQQKAGPVIVLNSSTHRELEIPSDKQDWKCCEQRYEPALSDNDIYMW